MTALGRFRAVLTLWLLVRLVLLLNRLSSFSAAAENQETAARQRPKSAIRARYGNLIFLNFEPRVSSTDEIRP